MDDRNTDEPQPSEQEASASDVGESFALETPAEPERAQRHPLDVPRAIEAVLMVADDPLSLVTLATAVGAPMAAVRQAIDGLVADYDGEDGGQRRGFELREVGGGWRLYVRDGFDDLVAEFVNQQTPTRLSQAALETLAVIAYRQPITRGAIASIRAVNVDSVVRTLLSRGLITEQFTDAETGAINYGTTDLLLQQLGINSIEELPLISPLLADGTDGFDDDVR
ncbi:MAG TPA: SMC-Scp complex subunit ScpB [Humibacter sp.]|jgi:segregation and condensation protein B|nr:SMC-Scp complex subunit ScpB [Humibacter sp.]